MNGLLSAFAISFQTSLHCLTRFMGFIRILDKSIFIDWLKLNSFFELKETE